MKIDGNGVLLFGKYEGRTVEDISLRDKSYLEWCYDNVPDEVLRSEIEKCI